MISHKQGTATPPAKVHGASGMFGAHDRGRSRAEGQEVAQGRGHILIVAGFVMAMLGVLLYCAACLTANASTALDDMLIRGTVPHARWAIALIFGGTLTWLAGAITFFQSTMDDES